MYAYVPVASRSMVQNETIRNTFLFSGRYPGKLLQARRLPSQYHEARGDYHHYRSASKNRLIHGSKQSRSQRRRISLVRTIRLVVRMTTTTACWNTRSFIRRTRIVARPKPRSTGSVTTTIRAMRSVVKSPATA